MERRNQNMDGARNEIRNYNATNRLFKWNHQNHSQFANSSKYFGSVRSYLLILHGSPTSQTVGPGPGPSAPGGHKRQSSQAAGARPAKRTTQAADYEDLYAIDADKKIECLRTMDRVQWNVTITNQLDNTDCTEA